MATNTELVKVIIASQSREALEQAALNLAQRLDIIANMKSESPVGQLQLITEARFFQPQDEGTAAGAAAYEASHTAKTVPPPARKP